jgi:hypothetical protein
VVYHVSGGTHAYGEIVRHDNPDGPGQFSWPYDVLDITLPADQQPGAWGGQTSAYQAYFGDSYPAFSYSTTYQVNRRTDSNTTDGRRSPAAEDPSYPGQDARSLASRDQFELTVIEVHAAA